MAGSLALGAAGLAAITACGSFDAESSPPTAALDGEADATPSADVSVVPNSGGCERTGKFTSVRRVEGVNSPLEEYYPRLSADELVIYFQRFGAAGIVTMFRASRTSTAKAFGAPVALGGLPPTARHPFPSSDDQTLLFVVYADPRYEIWSARRPDAGVPFANAARIASLVGAGSSLEPALSADGRELFFASQAAGARADVWRAFAVDGGYDSVAPVAELNSVEADQGPVLSEDALELYFYSDRGAVAGLGTIWRSYRDSRGEQFRNVARVDELVPDAGFTEPGHLSADGCRLYFFSDMDKSTGTDIYVAERAPAR